MFKASYYSRGMTRFCYSRHPSTLYYNHRNLFSVVQQDCMPCHGLTFFLHFYSKNNIFIKIILIYEKACIFYIQIIFDIYIRKSFYHYRSKHCLNKHAIDNFQFSAIFLPNLHFHPKIRLCPQSRVFRFCHTII